MEELFELRFTFNPKSDKIGVSSSVADIRQAKEILGFEAKIKIEDAIRKEYL